MSLLTLEDAGIYFSADLIEPDKFSPTISFLTGIVEGNLGAQRPLEKRSHTETQTLHLSQREYLVRCWPIDTAQPVTIEMRWINRRDRFRRRPPDTIWETLVLDRDYAVGTDRIEFLDTESNLTQDFRRVRTQTVGQPEIRLNYTGGIDFEADDLSVEAIGLKFSMAQLLEYHTFNMGAAVSRIRSEDVYQESSVSYFGTDATKSAQPGMTAVGGWPEYLMIPFQAYRPYQYRF